MNVKDSFTSRVLPHRSETVEAVIIHTTGDTDLPKILKFYQAEDGLQPHYVIGLDGTVFHIVHEYQVAYHCKIDPAEARLYQLGYSEWSKWVWKDEQPYHTGQEASNYRTWRNTWGNTHQSPLDLVTGAHPNGTSIGIELQQPTKPGPQIFTDYQYMALAELICDIETRHPLALNRERLLGHYDCSPMRRSTASGGWDPGERFSFNKLFDLLGL